MTSVYRRPPEETHVCSRWYADPWGYLDSITYHCVTCNKVAGFWRHVLLTCFHKRAGYVPRPDGLRAFKGDP